MGAEQVGGVRGPFDIFQVCREGEGNAPELWRRHVRDDP